MGIREKLNNNPALVGGVVVVVTLAAVLYGYMAMPRQAKIDIPTTAFYTDDNGASYFEDDLDKIVPFEHKGKQAYRAWVFRCGSDKPFVGVIGRHNERGRELLTENQNKPKKEQEPDLFFTLEGMGMEIKKAGADDKGWVINDELTGARLKASVTCPSGEPAEPVQP